MKKINPFSDYGGIVQGERFVGRLNEIEVIRNRLLGENYGNMSIVGLPRVGKSSVAWNSIMTLKPQLLNQKIIPIWLSFGEFDSLLDIFEEIFYNLEESLENPEFGNLNIDSNFQKFKKAESNLEKRRYVKRILKFLVDNNVRLVIIMDEFDHSKEILTLSDFQFLRELSYNPDTKLSLLTISRKTLQELEPDNGALSNFYQIFADLRLKLFSYDDNENYWNRLSTFGISVSKEYKTEAKYFCGSHPFLLDVFNNESFNHLTQHTSNLDKLSAIILKALNLKMMNEYESVLKLMKLEGLSSAVTQVVVGPVYDITQRDIEKLLKYGIIDISSEGTYLTFSEYFKYYLELKSSEIDIWPLWSDVENEVRSLIKLGLTELYGKEWENEYIKKFKQKNAENFLSEKRLMQSKNEKSFGSNVSQHLVDYTYPLEMYDKFIALDWEWYSKIFGKQKSDWKSIFEHLGKIRNPLAHNNPDFLSNSDITIAEGYCHAILEKIAQWKKNTD